MMLKKSYRSYDEFELDLPKGGSDLVLPKSKLDLDLSKDELDMVLPKGEPNMDLSKDELDMVLPRGELDMVLPRGELDMVLPRGKIVFTNGCFDILHHGHFRTLEESKALGDILIVGLNSDDSVRRLKGDKRPINGWAKRAEQLENISCVDFVIGFSEDTPLELITALKPDVITKGGDYTTDEMIGKDVIMSYGGEVVILPYHKGYSTTQIIETRRR